MEATTEDLMGRFLEEGETFLQTWEKVILTFGPSCGADPVATLYRAIQRLREACHSTGYHDFGVLVRVVEALTIDVQRGFIGKNDETRNLLIDFHGVVERWIRSRPFAGEPRESTAEILSRMISRSLSVRQTLLHNSALDWATWGNEEILAAYLAEPQTNVTDDSQGTGIAGQDVLTLDRELTQIWNHLASLEDLLKNRGLSQEEADTLGQLHASVRYTKDKLLKYGHFPSHTALCEALIVQSGGMPVAIPLADLDAVMNLVDLNIAHDRLGNSSVTFQDRHYPIRALDEVMKSNLPRHADCGPKKVALLATLARGPAALTVEGIFARKTVLVRQINKQNGYYPSLKGMTTFEKKNCLVINTKQLTIG